jgi:hypothetical protein
MSVPHLTHEIICVGSHDQHDFHVANAKAIHDLFTGGLGPSRALSTSLAGQRVTASAVDHALESAVDRAATNLVFFYSGQADAAGLHVADGPIPPKTLEKYFGRTASTSILLILDLAIGAEPDQALLPEWLHALVASREGIRVAVARATRIGAGAEGEGLGRFTAAIIKALESAPGDSRLDNTRYISDKLAMEHARTSLGDRWGLTNFPLKLGEFGDLPLTRSQAAAPIGTGSISSLAPGKGLSAAVTWTLDGRNNMKTTLNYAIVRQDGTPVAEDSLELVPANPLQKGKTRVRFPKSALKGTAEKSLLWRVALLDARGRALADMTLDLPQ